MHAEDFVVYDSRHGQTIEAIGEDLPKADAEAAFAFIVKSVDPVDGSALVVSSEQEKVVWKLDFVGKEKGYGLDALFSSVHVVAQKKIVGVGRKPSHLEQSQQIRILAMNVTCRSANNIIQFSSQC